MGLVYVVARFSEEGDGREFAIMRDMDGNGAFESMDEASALMVAVDGCPGFEGSYFRIIGLNVKGA